MTVVSLVGQHHNFLLVDMTVVSLVVGKRHNFPLVDKAVVDLAE